MDPKSSLEISEVEEDAVKQMFHPCMMLSDQHEADPIARIIVQLAEHHRSPTTRRSTS
jgi:hypothetical protein